MFNGIAYPIYVLEMAKTIVLPIGKRFLNKIRRSLKQEDLVELSKSTGFSFSYIEKTLLGLRKNEQILHDSINLCNLPESLKVELRQKLIDYYGYN